MLASHALALVGVPMRRVIRIVQDQRDARYNLLRGYFHGADDPVTDDQAQERLANITLPAGAHCIGKHLAQLTPMLPGIRVVNLRHHHGMNITPSSDPVLEAGDTLVLSGKVDALTFAEQLLTSG
jgi:monovalent cation:H+ antiporter-2, CPA2 family